MSNLTVRIIVGAIGIPATIALTLYGGVAFRAITLIIAIFGLSEFYSMLKRKNARPDLALGVAAVVSIYSISLYPEAANFLPLIAASFILLTFAFQLWRSDGSALQDISATLTGVFYFPVLFLFLPLTHALNAPVEGRYLVLMLLISVWLCDSAAYFGGKLFGKRKLFERVSPNKTWEGAFVGFLGAIAGFAGVGVVASPNIHIIHWIALGGLIGVFGQIGDLAESLLKRDAGVKDSSSILPGHGGMLDRFDSMTFAAPITYFYVTLLIK